jgi:hypothetical protein
MSDNGGGGSGGNTSVIWEVWHGGRANPDPPNQGGGGGGVPGRGKYKVRKNRVTGHSNANFDQIGVPDHQGLFKVTLRFRLDEFEKLVDPREKDWVRQRATQSGDSLYLEIHVPAIYRNPPNGNDDWGNLPWEIEWEW